MRINNVTGSQDVSAILEYERSKMAFLPIADTFSGAMARERPAQTIHHYTALAQRLWISPQVRGATEEIFNSIGKGRVAWGSLIGPYGFGKTATSITIWQHAREAGFWAIPPLSCTNFDELAHGIAALTMEMHPRRAKDIKRIFETVWSENVSQMTERDAQRFGVDARTMRKILQGKLQAGELSFDSRPHRFVEFLSRLSELALKEGRGLVVVLDELQQLLGPLDARAIISFREFVWGIRTEHAPCGVFLSMDSLLEARLGRWAADLLHRIREHGPVLQLVDIYGCEFPAWLWQQATANTQQEGPNLEPCALDEGVLMSLGQFVERPDLASGPRTVVDTFARAITHWQSTGMPYTLHKFAQDLRAGRLRYFGEGAPVQRVLLDLLADEWIEEDEARTAWVELLAAFPSGCPDSVLRENFPDAAEFKRLRTELFGPLLVELPGGLALEALQRVRRSHVQWESVVARCWNQLPALDVVASHTPDIVRRILVPRLFPSPAWRLWNDASLFGAQSGASLSSEAEWTRWCGSFSSEFPDREVAVFVGSSEPATWPQDADFAFALVCQSEEDATPGLQMDAEAGRLTLHLPILRPMQDAPAELMRFRKHLEPEPLRAATVLLAVHELASLLELGEMDGILDIGHPQSAASQNGHNLDAAHGKSAKSGENDAFRLEHARAFVATTLDFLIAELLVGRVGPFQAGGKATPRVITLRGLDALRGAFVALCRVRFGHYQTLQTTSRWQEGLRTVRDALSHPSLSSRQRQGKDAITGPKAELVEKLFGYNSTAAFDSFQRSLGDILQVANAADNWHLTFALHPAEESLLSYTRDAGCNGITDEAAREYLRHLGYVPDEAIHIVSLLEARELLSRRADNRLALAGSGQASREALRREIEGLQSTLYGLATGKLLEGFVEDENDLPLGLRERRDALQKRLEAAIAAFAEDKAALQRRVLHLLGELRALPVPAEFPEGTFSTHLGGIARNLSKSHTALLNEGRKIRTSLDESGEPRRPDDTSWAMAWKETRGSLLNALERFEGRAKENGIRQRGLVLWRDAAAREGAIRSRVEQVGASQPNLVWQLAQLTREFSELFAIGGWEPLMEVGRFNAGLSEIENELQKALWSQMEAYLRSVATLRERWGALLPASGEPLRVPSADEETHLWLHEQFEALHIWALDSFEATWERCRRIKGKGTRWRHPTNSKKKWSELNAELEEDLKKARKTLSPHKVQIAAERLQAMVNGFEASALRADNIVGVHECDRLDFDRLQLLHAQGRIRITVEEVPKAGDVP